MIPLRNALIVKEHGNLPYPEGTACAEVLLAGEEGGSEAKTVFWGIGLSAAFRRRGGTALSETDTVFPDVNELRICGNAEKMRKQARNQPDLIY